MALLLTGFIQLGYKGQTLLIVMRLYATTALLLELPYIIHAVLLQAGEFGTLLLMIILSQTKGI